MIFCTGAAAAAALDLAVKQYVLDNVPKGEDREMAGGRLVLRKVYNRGAAFNILEQSPQFVMKLSACLGAVLLVRDVFLMSKKGHVAEKAGMMLLTGGALSNLWDRAMRGKVVDYLAFRSRWKRLSGLTLNLGDICIAAGALLAAMSRRK